MNDSTTPYEQRGSAHDTAVSDENGARVFPWPPAEHDSVAGAFVATWQGATLQPAAFFRAMPARSLTDALLYYLPLGILIAGAELFWESVRPAALAPEAVLGIGSESALLSPLITFLLSPLVLLLSLFLSAGVTHLLLKVFGTGGRGFGVSTRVFAFAYSPMLFGVVPVIGTIVGFVWMCVVAIVGLREAHGTSTGRAAAAVIIPIVIALSLIGIVMLIAAAGSLLETPI